MKAYCVFPAPDPMSSGCVLVWAETRGKAKAWAAGRMFMEFFIELRARRAPEYDQYYEEGKTHLPSNDHLPEGAPPFYTEVV